MKPIEFKEQNCTYAKNQLPYLPLPVHKTEGGEVISCWHLSWRERFKVLFTGRVWHSVLVFNQLLQPQFLSVDTMFKRVKPKAKGE